MKTYLIVIAFAVVMVLLGGSCKHDPPVGPKSKCDTCITPCDTCKDSTHHVTSNDTSSHNFIWAQSSISGEASLSGCWVFGPKDIYVVGGAVWKYDGAKWTNVSPTDQRGVNLSGGLSGFSMFAQSESDYWLTYAGNVINVSGLNARLFLLDSLKPGFLHSSWGTSSSDMYSVGDGGTILHFDGNAWTKMASGTTKDLHSIWGTSDQNIWAAGYNDTKGTVAIVHYDGSQWVVIDNSVLPGQVGGPGGDGVGSVWTVDSASQHHVYASGAYLYRQINGGAWSRDSGTLKNALSGGGFASLDFMRGNSANDYFIAGSGGFLSHWNGRSWMFYNQFFNFNSASHDTYGLAVQGNTACMVGVDNGKGWVVIGQR
jgi:hypothetical protein